MINFSLIKMKAHPLEPGGPMGSGFWVGGVGGLSLSRLRRLEGWRLACRPVLTFACATCGKETSATAGTVMHRSHLPLGVWFWAAFLMATHSNGMSAMQLKSELGLGSYKTAWLLAMKLRRAMVAPSRTPLAGFVEVDETEILCNRESYRGSPIPGTTSSSWE